MLMQSTNPGKELEVPEEQPSFWDGPVKIILALFIVFLMVAWYIPSQWLPENPAPGYTPTIDEVISQFPWE